jgi:hypothetical protein
MAAEQEAHNLRMPQGLSDAIKRMAAISMRSVNAEIVYALTQWCSAIGYRPEEFGVEPISRPVVAGPTPEPLPPAAVVETPPLPPGKAPSPSRSIALVVRDIVDAAPLHGRAVQTFEKIVREHFPDIQSIEDARSKGPDAWLSAEASPGIMKGLFPNLPELGKTAAMMRQRTRDQEAKISGRRDRRVGWSAG